MKPENSYACIFKTPLPLPPIISLWHYLLAGWVGGVTSSNRLQSLELEPYHILRGRRGPISEWSCLWLNAVWAPDHLKSCLHLLLLSPYLELGSTVVSQPFLPFLWVKCNLAFQETLILIKCVCLGYVTKALRLPTKGKAWHATRLGLWFMCRHPQENCQNTLKA